MTVLWIAGPRAVGKSSVGWEVFTRLFAHTRTGYIDLAQITFATPAPDLPARAERLDAVRRTYQQAGARHLVITGDHADLTPDAKLYWLHADEDRLLARLLLRSQGRGPAIPGDDLRDLPEKTLRHLVENLPTPAADLVIDTNDRPIHDIATEILDHAFPPRP